MTEVGQFELLPGALEGIVDLARCGFELVVASNQRGVARELVSEGLLRQTEDVLQEALAPHDVRIASFRYCPHECSEACECRKPRPGMLLDAAHDLAIDLASSWMVGDSDSDVEAGAAAGCRTVGLSDGAAEPTLRAESLRDAAALICQES